MMVSLERGHLESKKVRATGEFVVREWESILQKDDSERRNQGCVHMSGCVNEVIRWTEVTNGLAKLLDLEIRA